MSLLRIEDLSKSFGGVIAVADLSFTIDPGAIYSIIGPNGAGKTTVINLISGIFRPSKGRIFFEDQDVTGLAPYELARRGLSRIFQNLQVFSNMTALENVMVGHHLHCDRRFLPALLRLPRIVRGDAACREFAAELMASVGLGDYVHAEASMLPYGALKRLEIARALATIGRAGGGPQSGRDGRHRPPDQGHRRKRRDRAAGRARHAPGHGHQRPYPGARPRSLAGVRHGARDPPQPRGRGGLSRRGLEGPVRCFG
jgi:ABC-type lipopolysaccharide export system ATPase subunit